MKAPEIAALFRALKVKQYITMLTAQNIQRYKAYLVYKMLFNSRDQ